MSAFDRERRLDVRLDGEVVQTLMVVGRRAGSIARSADGDAGPQPARVSSPRTAGCPRQRTPRHHPARVVDRGGHVELAISGHPTMTVRSAYRDFWAGVGERFPDLGGAASTRYYADNEERLFSEHFGPLKGLSILKTDLWDEAKNTRILVWAAQQGALTYGVDIHAIVRQAALRRCRPRNRRSFAGQRGGDVRDLPFPDAASRRSIRWEPSSTSMNRACCAEMGAGPQAWRSGITEFQTGTIHSFARAGDGPPGHQAFLATGPRVLLTQGTQAMVENAGLEVVAETAILFMPGCLRMLDLACHAWCRPLARVTAALVRPFMLLDRHIPAVRNHGYLLAIVARKPLTS